MSAAGGASSTLLSPSIVAGGRREPGSVRARRRWAKIRAIVAILAAASRQQRTASARKRLSDGQYSTDYLLTVLNINNVDLSQLQDVAPLKESVFLAVLLSDIVKKDIEETGTLTSWPFNSLHRLLFSELAFETLTAELIESLDEDMKEYEDHEKIYTDGIVRKQK